jgi:ferritin-like metal-binding protein YciE
MPEMTTLQDAFVEELRDYGAEKEITKALPSSSRRLPTGICGAHARVIRPVG